MDATEILQETLNSGNLFDKKEIETISSFFEKEELSKNEILFEKGRKYQKIVFVATGVLHSFIYDNDGETVTKTFITENDFFTELDSFEKNQPCAFHVSAITDCTLLTLTKSNSQELSKQIPKWELSFKNEAMMAMNSMIKDQEFLAHGEAIDKYKHFVKHFPDLAQKVPLKYIASYLNITQSSLSRIRRKEW